MAPAFGVSEVLTASADHYQLKIESHDAPGWVTGEATIRVRPEPPMSAE